MQEKKKYLNSYLLQQTTIISLEKMKKENPDRKDEFEQRITKAKNLRLEIENKIAEVDDGILSSLLTQKYIFGNTLEETALILNYSKRHIERLHIKALEKFNI